jgi:uncharacterized membrane protein HdeD (DUF308 family)
MVGSIGLALGFVVLAVIASVVVPAVGWLLAILLVAAAIVVVVRAFAAGRRQTAPRP